MRPSLKGPLIIAAVFVVARVVVERLGAPPLLSNLISVSTLCVIVFPVYFAWQIAGSSSTRPYRDLFVTIAVYALLARAMVMPVYWLAYLFKWPEQRFGGDGGVVGPEFTLASAIITPFALTAIWTISSIIVGGGVGSAIIALKRRQVARTA
jgi:hypothetical protein